MTRTLCVVMILGCAEGITQDPAGSTSTNTTGTGAANSDGGGATTGAGASADGGAPNGGAPNGGSSGTGTQGLGYENGARLRANALVGTDGSRQFRSWQDTDLQVECAFVLAEDGQTRCLPTGATAYFTGAGYFADSACTEVATTVACTNQSPVYGWEFLNTCPTSTRIYSLAGTSAALYLGDGTSCTAVPIPPSQMVVKRGAAVPASNFVGASIVTE